MQLFYLIAILPFIGILIWKWIKPNMPWVLFSCWMTATILIPLIFHVCAANRIIADTETWSGQVSQARHFTRWVEYYEYAVYRTEYYTVSRTDSDGKSYTTTESREVFDHWEPTTRTHEDSWECYDTLPRAIGITQARYTHIFSKFGKQISVAGSRQTGENNSRMIAGDPNDRVTVNVNQYIYPVNDGRTFDNKVKRCPSLFSYVKVPEDVQVFPYPKNTDTFSSDRLCGNTGLITRDIDVANAIIGPTKKINLVVCAFGDKDSTYADWQESAWTGGKKNDFVICFGGMPNKPTWTRVFGWSESFGVKRQVEAIVLQKGMSSATLTAVSDAIVNGGYEHKDWKKFDYIHFEIPTSWFLVELGVFVFVLGILAAIIIYDQLQDQRIKPYWNRSSSTYRRVDKSGFYR